MHKYLAIASFIIAINAQAETTIKPVNQFGQVQHQQGGYVVKQQSDGSAVIKPTNQFGQVQHHLPAYKAKPSK